MPLGKYKTFSSCVAAQKRKGLSEENARKYCGKIEQSVKGKKHARR